MKINVIWYEKKLFCIYLPSCTKNNLIVSSLNVPLTVNKKIIIKKNEKNIMSLGFKKFCVTFGNPNNFSHLFWKSKMVIQNQISRFYP